MHNTGKNIFKVLTILLLSLILIIFISLGLIKYQAPVYLNGYLQEFVQRKSKGNYQIQFNKIEFKLLKIGVKIDQILLQPSDSVLLNLSQSDTTKQYFSIYSPEIELEGIQLFHLIFNKNLEINKISINQPELKIHGQKTISFDQQNNVVQAFQELKPLVTKLFYSIKINKIELTNASFDFYKLLGDTKKLSNAENITIGILNFYTDSILLPDKNRLFDAEDIYLQMQNFEKILKDSLHIFKADEVVYSLKHSRVEAQNVELMPYRQEPSNHGKFSIIIPWMKLTSKDINDIYRIEAIKIDSLSLLGAKISYRPGKKNDRISLKKPDEFDLYDLIKTEFSQIEIKNFSMEQAELMLFQNQTDDRSQQNIKDIKIKLEDFLLDSISIRDTSRIFYSKMLELSALTYELTLVDELHQVKAGPIFLSTQKRSVLINNIQLNPVELTSNALNLIDAQCDSIRFDLFDFKKAYHEQRFIFKRINLYHPSVHLTQNEKVIMTEISNSSSFIYSLISGYLKGIYAQQVNVRNGKIKLINKTGSLQKGYIESTIKLTLNGFSLDEVSSMKTDRLFFANQIELGFENYKMQLVDQLHQLTIKEFNLSSKKKKASLLHLHLFHDSIDNVRQQLTNYKRSELYDFQIPEMSLSNVDFHEAFYNKKLSIDTMSIQNPNLYYENFAFLKPANHQIDFEDLFQLLSGYLGDIQINRTLIPDGQIRLINHNRKEKTLTLNNRFSLSLKNTIVNNEQFGKERLLFSDFVDFTVRDHLIKLSDNIHLLKASEIGFSTERKEIFAINSKLYPEAGSKDFSSIFWNFQLNIPEIRIKGINVENFYFNQIIDADYFLINSPDIKLYKKRAKTKNQDFKEIKIPLPKQIQSIAIRKFRLNEGSLKVFSELTTKPYLLVQSDLNMDADNLVITKNKDLVSTDFKSGNFVSSLLQFNFYPKDKNQQFGVDELTFSTQNRTVIARQLSVKPKSKNPKQDQFEVLIPLLTMNGFDLDEAYQKDQFFFESIEIEKPILNIYNNNKDSIKINPYKVDFYPHFESFSDEFFSKKLLIKDATISIIKNGQLKFKQAISFNLFNFKITDQPSNKFLNAENFSVLIPKFSRKEKFYEYTFDEASYSTFTNQFVVRQLKITPNFIREVFQKKQGFQTDYFKGDVDSILIDRPDIKRLFENDFFSGKVLSVHGLDLNILRDKRVPFDEKRRPKMLQDLIKSFEYSFQLDTLKLINSRFTYTEQAEDGQKGVVRFTDVQAGLIPFTNRKIASGLYPNFRVDASATVMDSCKLNTKMVYQMNHPDNLFKVIGSLSPFNMSILNPVLEPLTAISMRSGMVNRFEFDFNADQNSAKGKLMFGYDNLRISVLETKNGDTKESKFASFLANSLVLKTRNPRGNELLADEIYVTRDEKRSTINYWWKAVFSGVKNTLGIKDKQQEPE